MSYIISPPEETALQAHLHKLRTQLHEDPELSWQEHRTTRLVRRELEALCLEPVPLGLPTGTAALLRGALPGPTVGPARRSGRPADHGAHRSGIFLPRSRRHARLRT